MTFLQESSCSHRGNYYYNLGDHGGVIVSVKYIKTEGATNILEYSMDEAFTWHQHQSTSCTRRNSGYSG